MSLAQARVGRRTPRLHLHDDADALAGALAEAFVAAARPVVGHRPFFVVLPGGTSPVPLLRRLVTRHAEALDWERVRFAWSDERWVPVEDPASNYGLVHEHLFEPLGLDPERVACAVSTELPTTTIAAAEYEGRLRAWLVEADGRFDWGLLGMGSDGHTASLFPGRSAPEDPWVIPVDGSPKPPATRVTMTWTVLRRARALHVVATGAGKATAVRQGLDAPTDVSRYPLHGSRAAEGTVDWWLDRAAAGEVARG